MPVRVALPLSPSAYTYTSYPFVLDGKPATVTVVVVFPVSKYPFIIRAFPGASVIHVDQVLFEVHDTVAVVAAPVSSTNASGAVLAAPLALFQFGSATTPATSADPIGTSPPTKSMLSTFPVVPPDEATVKLTVAVCVSVPLVPVIVSVYVPAAVLLPVATVSVALPPAGSPLTLSPTVPVNPFTAPVFTVYVVLLPAFTVCALGVPDKLKSGLGELNGTIWMPWTGARGYASVERPGVAVMVKPDTFGIVNTT